MMPAAQVGELGTMAVVGDPGGAAIGIWSPMEFKGFGLVNEPGAPVWFELHTTDYDRSVAFYRDVFDWETSVMSDEPNFRYTTSMHDGESVAGVFDVAGVFAGMFVLAAFVVAIDFIVTLVEKRLLVWRPVVGDSRP